MLAIASSAGELNDLYASRKIGTVGPTVSYKPGETGAAMMIGKRAVKVQAVGGREFSARPVVTGMLVRTDGAGLDVFVGGPVPQYVAYSAGGRTVVRPAGDNVPLDGADEPWLLFWLGDKADPKDPSDHPILLVLQHPARSAAFAKDRVSLSVAGQAGTVILMPLRGLARLATRTISKTVRSGNRDIEQDVAVPISGEWAGGLPEAVAGEVRQWARRLRWLPEEVSETFQIVPDGVRITETFTGSRIGDAWKTPSRPWAMLPPPFAFARRMRGPVTVQGECADLPYLAAFGLIGAADGTESVSCTLRIPQLPDYLAADRWRPADLPDRPEVRHLRAELAREVDKAMRSAAEPEGPRPSRGPSVKTPGLTVLALASAVPLLDEDRAEAVKTFLRDYFAAHNPLKSPDYNNAYAAWQYVANVAGTQEGKRLWTDVQAFMKPMTAGFRWDAAEGFEAGSNSDPARSGIGRLNSYIAYARFARLAGDRRAEELAACLLARGLVVKYGLAWYQQYLIDIGVEKGIAAGFPAGSFCDDPGVRTSELGSHRAGGWDFGSGMYGSRVRYAFFYDLSPEVGQFLGDCCRQPVASVVRYTEWKYPGHWMGRSANLFKLGEELIVHPWHGAAGFQARGLALQERPEDLYWIVGDAHRADGDLYSIVRLCTALRAFAGRRVP